MRTEIDTNEQYEHRDNLIISGPDLPVASQNKNSKIIVKNLLSENGVTVDLNDISIAHRTGRKPTNPTTVDKRGIIFKLCCRDLVQIVFNACKRIKPSSALVAHSCQLEAKYSMYSVSSTRSFLEW